MNIPGRIGLGCVTFGREIDEDASFRILDHAFERGVRLLDTAEAYGEGASEIIVGRWLRRSGVRSQMILCTKITRGYTAANLRAHLAASLDRLQCDFVDLYYLHQFDPSVAVEDAVAGLRDSVRSGCARAVASSNFTVEQLEQYRDAGFSALQPPYNLLARDLDHGLGDYCCERKMALISYSPLAAGFLTGKYTPDRAAVPPDSRFGVKPAHADIYFHERNFAIVAGLRDLANRTGYSMSRLAMGWALANPQISCVLAGAREPRQVDNGIDAASNPLPGDWIAEMGALG